MANLIHPSLTNHPTDPIQHNLHTAGIVVATAAALAAVTTWIFGDLAFETDISAIGFYDGSNFDWFASGVGALTNNVVNSPVTVPANTSAVVVGTLMINAGKTLTLQAGASLLIL